MTPAINEKFVEIGRFFIFFEMLLGCYLHLSNEFFTSDVYFEV
jgi:hypothetical protein